MCIYVRENVHISAGPRKVLDPLEPELHTVMGH